MTKRGLGVWTPVLALGLFSAAFAKAECLSDLEVLNLMEGEACTLEGRLIQDTERFGRLPPAFPPYSEQQASVLAQVGFWDITEADDAAAQFGGDYGPLFGIAIDALRKSCLLSIWPPDRAEPTGPMAEKQGPFFVTLVALEKTYATCGTAPENTQKAKDSYNEMARHLRTDVRFAGLLGAACLWAV